MITLTSCLTPRKSLILIDAGKPRMRAGNDLHFKIREYYSTKKNVVIVDTLYVKL